MPEVFTPVPVGWVLSPSPAVGSIGNHILTFSFRQEKIAEAWCDLLVSNFRDPKTITLMKENIGHIFDGSLSHCADTLKLGLKKAVNLKKQRDGVKLKCSGGPRVCPQRYEPVSYLSLDSKIRCTGCGRSDRMTCAGCQFRRTDGCISCRGCGKWFL